MSTSSNSGKASPDAAARALLAPFIELSTRATATINRLLSHRRLLTYATAIIILQIVYYTIRIAFGSFPYDASGVPFGVDLSAFMIGATTIQNGDVSHLYQADYQLAVQHTMFPEIRSDNYLYFYLPPLMAYVLAPLAWLPYASVLAIWVTLMACLMAIAFRMLWPLLPQLHQFGARGVLFIACATLIVADSFYTGQITALWLLLLVSGLRLALSGRDIPAGIVWGLGLLKPPLFFLLPILLLGQKRYKSCAAFIATSAVLAMTNFLMVGTSGVADYKHLIGSERYFTWNADLITWKMTTLIALLRYSTGVATTPSLLATGLTLCVALVGAVVVWIIARTAHRKRPDLPFQVTFAITMFVTYVFAPHALTYDGVVLIAAGLILLNYDLNSAALKVLLFAPAALAATMTLRVVTFLPAPSPLNLVAAPWYPLFFLALIAYMYLRVINIDSTATSDEVGSAYDTTSTSLAYVRSRLRA